MTTPDEEKDWVTVLTTLPTLPPNTQRPRIETERLVLRPLTEDDLQDIYALRSRPAVMKNTKRGVPDDDIDYTRERLAPFLPPHDIASFNFAICLRAANDNKLIGVGGVHVFRSNFGWPEAGYMLHDEHWGKGYATEFLRAFVKAYSALPRAEPGLLRVDPYTLPADVVATIAADPEATPAVDEILAATVADRNPASQKVIMRGGFVEYSTRLEPEWSNPEVDILLRHYRYLPGWAAAE